FTSTQASVSARVNGGQKRIRSGSEKSRCKLSMSAGRISRKRSRGVSRRCMVILLLHRLVGKNRQSLPDPSVSRTPPIVLGTVSGLVIDHDENAAFNIFRARQARQGEVALAGVVI